MENLKVTLTCNFMSDHGCNRGHMGNPCPCDAYHITTYYWYSHVMHITNETVKLLTSLGTICGDSVSSNKLHLVTLHIVVMGDRMETFCNDCGSPVGSPQTLPLNRPLPRNLHHSC